MIDNSISIYDFLTKEETIIHFDKPVSGHDGGDDRIMRSFIKSIRNLKNSEKGDSSAKVSVRGYLMALLQKNRD